MAEPRSPLAGLAPLTGPRIALIELPHLAKIDVRGRDATPALVAALTSALGATPPLEANRSAPAGVRTVLWLGPGEWRVVGPSGDAAAIVAALQAAIPRALAGIVDVSDFYTTLHLSGAGARDVLAQGCPLDLHPRRFATGNCARSLLAKADILLHQRDDTPSFDIDVRWSLAAYLWAWLASAAGLERSNQTLIYAPQPP
jgi:sarcosine oxidase subunit gamma